MQIKNNITKIMLLGLIILSFSSCDKFLDERPSKTTSLPINSIAQLEALLSNYSTFYAEGNRTVIYSSDDYELPVSLYNARPGTFSSMATIQFMLWDTEFLPDDTREVFWSTEFRKIFTANLVLRYVDQVAGDAALKAQLKAEAYLVRAYSYWVLANTYCLPYTDANKNEIGLPLKTSTSFEEDLVRQPLEKVYQFIEADLKEALKITNSMVVSGVARHWRGSKEAANGFAARYYLHRNNYTEALKHANAALQGYSTLVDYNTEMKYGNDQVVSINPGTGSQNFTIKYPYTHNNQTDFTDMVGWKEFLYFRMLNHESWWYIPSQSLLNLYDQTHDLRYRYHIVEGYSYDRAMTNPAYNYPGYIFFFKDRIPSGPTTAEMLLIKAECLARTNDVAGALTAVNTLRVKRMEPGTWVNLTAANKDEAVKKILEERRREMPFTQRWFDIRRYNNNEDPTDDVSLERTFYPYTIAAVKATDAPVKYTLTKNSRRFAAPIPRTEMISSQGVIEQNTY